jgi:hypothetical protein
VISLGPVAGLLVGLPVGIVPGADCPPLSSPSPLGPTLVVAVVPVIAVPREPLVSSWFVVCL